ncbi:hypothetical protein LOZ07_006296, partial [Ophidiomyces ophidiicola]
SCVYVNAANNNAHGKPGPSAKQYPAYLNGLHDRIRHLEAIVLNLVGPRASVADSSDPQDEPHIAESVERLSIDDDGSSYFGSSTWQAILDEVCPPFCCCALPGPVVSDVCCRERSAT